MNTDTPPNSASNAATHTVNKINPIVNGCYIDVHNNMFKVILVSHSGLDVNRVSLEDIHSNVISFDIKKWQELQLIPCCQSSSEIQKQPLLSQ